MSIDNKDREDVKIVVVHAASKPVFHDAKTTNAIVGASAGVAAAKAAVSQVNDLPLSAIEYEDMIREKLIRQRTIPNSKWSGVSVQRLPDGSFTHSVGPYISEEIADKMDKERKARALHRLDLSGPPGIGGPEGI